MTTVADVVAQVRDGRLEDFIREAVMVVARELMEAEITAEVHAGLGEIAPEARVTHRYGYRPRAWETRRSEQAIIAVVLEAYVNGVSTRKVDRLAEQLGIDQMTKDCVSHYEPGRGSRRLRIEDDLSSGQETLRRCHDHGSTPKS